MTLLEAVSPTVVIATGSIECHTYTKVSKWLQQQQQSQSNPISYTVASRECGFTCTTGTSALVEKATTSPGTRRGDVLRGRSGLPIKCYECGENHYVQDCPKNTPRNPRGKGTSVVVSPLVAVPAPGRHLAPGSEPHLSTGVRDE